MSMRKRELDGFRRLLEERLVHLYNSAHGKLRDGMQRSTFAQDESRDEGDEAQRIVTRDAAYSMGEREVALAQKIEAALRRITSGEYGECVDCGGQIELARLKAVPWADRCVADQEALEFDGRDRSPSL